MCTGDDQGGEGGWPTVGKREGKRKSGGYQEDVLPLLDGAEVHLDLVGAILKRVLLTYCLT